jgi:hypothetical protein
MTDGADLASACYLCHRPLLWDQRTTMWLIPGTTARSEVHSACKEAFERGEPMAAEVPISPPAPHVELEPDTEPEPLPPLPAPPGCPFQPAHVHAAHGEREMTTTTEQQPVVEQLALWIPGEVGIPNRPLASPDEVAEHMVSQLNGGNLNPPTADHYRLIPRTDASAYAGMLERFIADQQRVGLSVKVHDAEQLRVTITAPVDQRPARDSIMMQMGCLRVLQVVRSAVVAA